MSPRTKPPGGDRGRSLEVEWTTISYRTIAIYLVLAFLLVLGILYLISPQLRHQYRDASAGNGGRQSRALPKRRRAGRKRTS